MKKKITIATDFSGTAQNAYLYARKMAEALNVPLEIIHVAAESSTPLDVKSLESRLQSFEELYPHGPMENVISKVTVESKVLQGKTIPMLLSISKDPMIELLVMGNKGDSEDGENGFGSVAASVAQKAECPVLIIPKSESFTGLSNILYASNLESAIMKMMKEVQRIGNYFRSALHFIHVNNNASEEETEIIQDKIFNSLFEKGDPAFSFNLASISSENVTQGLRQYASENDIDLIVMVNKQYEVFDQYFEFSETRKMVAFSEKPLLVLHDHDF